MCSRNTRIDYALASLRMTYGEARALAVKRVAERIGAQADLSTVPISDGREPNVSARANSVAG